MNYLRFKIEIAPESTEILMAFLGELPFEALEEHAKGIYAYLPGDAVTEALEKEMAYLQQKITFQYSKEEIPDQNWNERWESSFKPIKVGPFCAVRADFHDAIPEVEHELIINPRMAFGTGHHETTFMMIQVMEGIDFKNKTVLDYGCGTGILAILASKMGAGMIEAVDIEEPAYENSIENAVINNVDNITCVFGTLDDISDSQFDIILANINRNVILSSLPALYQKLNENGYLLISGILIDDEPVLLPKIEESGFSVIYKMTRGEWACFKLGAKL